MSISVDDLVSSLSSSHIGQEAIDLAALQVGSFIFTRDLSLTDDFIPPGATGASAISVYLHVFGQAGVV